MNLEIISGSPRQQSTTLRVALYLQQQFSAQPGLNVNLIDLRQHPLPYMDQVIGSPEEAPEHLRELAARMFKADAFVVVTPEYNGSYAPAMQNFFDFFPKQRHKAFGLATASPGALGGIRAALKLQLFVLALFGIPSPFMLIVPGVDKKFDEAGNLIDSSFQNSVDLFIREFLWLARRMSAAAEQPAQKS